MWCAGNIDMSHGLSHLHPHCLTQCLQEINVRYRREIPNNVCVVSQVAVMQRVRPEPQHWLHPDTAIYFRVDGLSLSGDAMKDPAVSHVMLAHMFMEDYTEAAQQCTSAIMKRDGNIVFGYAVEYKLFDEAGRPIAAAVGLLQQLAAASAPAAAGAVAPRVVLPVLLATSQQSVVKDFSQGEWITMTTP